MYGALAEEGSAHSTVDTDSTGNYAQGICRRSEGLGC